MSELELENKNETNNLSEKIQEMQEKFLESSIGKTINSAIDIGLKAILPDFVEDQIISIKDAILENGFSDGLKEVVNEGINTGKSAIGIVTGKFDNISQIQLAVKNGGILDSTSDLLDFAINIASSKNLINKSTATLIKSGKNTIINSISDKIEQTLTNQLKAVEKLEKYCDNWNVAYEAKDVSGMEKAYKNIKTNLEKTVPLEKIINKARTIENINNLLKNNNYSFDLSEEEIELSKKLATY